MGFALCPGCNQPKFKTYRFMEDVGKYGAAICSKCGHKSFRPPPPQGSKMVSDTVKPPLYGDGLNQGSKIPLGVRFYFSKPEKPEIGDIVFSYPKGNVELYTHAGWLELCAMTDEMKEELEKPSPEEVKKEKIKQLFGRKLDI